MYIFSWVFDKFICSPQFFCDWRVHQLYLRSHLLKICTENCNSSWRVHQLLNSQFIPSIYCSIFLPTLLACSVCPSSLIHPCLSAKWTLTCNFTSLRWKTHLAMIGFTVNLNSKIMGFSSFIILFAFLYLRCDEMLINFSLFFSSHLFD